MIEKAKLFKLEYKEQEPRYVLALNLTDASIASEGAWAVEELDYSISKALLDVMLSSKEATE